MKEEPNIGQEMKKYQRFSPESEEYQEDLELQRWVETNFEKVFGAEDLQEILLLETDSGIEEKQGKRKETCYDKLRWQWEKLGQKSKDFWYSLTKIFHPDTACYQLIEEAWDNLEIRSELQKRFRRIVKTDYKFKERSFFSNNEEEFKKQIIIGKIAYNIFKRSGSLKDLPDALLLKMTKNHVEIFKAREEEFNAELTAEKEKVKERILLALDDNKLLPILEDTGQAVLAEDKEVLEQRINRAFENYNVRIADPVLVEMLDLGGSCSVKNLQILISSRVIKRGLEKTFVHEFLHAVAGQTVLRNMEEADIDEGVNIGGFVQQRQGLMFTGSKSSYYIPGMEKGKTRFFWLNEAVTEDLVGQAGLEKESYPECRELLDLIVRDMGSEEKIKPLFYRAYFEDFDPSLPVGQRVPYWKELGRKMEENFGKGYLLKLDEYIQRNGFPGRLGWLAGVEKASEQYLKYGKEIEKWEERV